MYHFKLKLDWRDPRCLKANTFHLGFQLSDAWHDGCVLITCIGWYVEQADAGDRGYIWWTEARQQDYPYCYENMSCHIYKTYINMECTWQEYQMGLLYLRVIPTKYETMCWGRKWCSELKTRQRGYIICIITYPWYIELNHLCSIHVIGPWEMTLQVCSSLIMLSIVAKTEEATATYTCP